jgi:hypothetical protein
MVMRRLGSGWRRRTICFPSSGGGFRFDGIKELMPSPKCFIVSVNFFSSFIFYTLAHGHGLGLPVIPAASHKFPLIQISNLFCSFLPIPTVGLAFGTFLFLTASAGLRLCVRGRGEDPCRFYFAPQISFRLDGRAI